MIVFAVGDVVGESGCRFVRSRLPAFRKYRGIDLCIANGENSAPGNGITPESAEYLLSSGVDFITTGNHVYRRREIYGYLDEKDYIIRPANFYGENPGRGYSVIDMGRYSVAVMNLSGNMYLDYAENAFVTAEKTLEKIKDVKMKLLDFHAEATSEKRAMGFFLDGRVSAVFGTHTHVQTADEQVLPGGTGYITDLGMTGPIQSVLGVDTKTVIDRFINGMPARFSNPDTACGMDGCIFELDEKSGKCLSVERIQLT